MSKALYAVFDIKKGVLKRSSKKGKIFNFYNSQPINTRKHLVLAERGVSRDKDYWRRIS